MSDELCKIKEKILQFRDERDWKQFHNSKDLALALFVECAELNELFLWKKAEEVNSDKLSEELADIFVCAFLLAENHNLDIAKIIEEKLEKNKLKYPIDKAKGNAKKYTEWSNIEEKESTIKKNETTSPSLQELTTASNNEADTAKTSFFAGKNVVITGTFNTLKRQDLENQVEQLGGEVKTSISKQIDYLIAGEKAGSKLKKAQEVGIEVLDESKFLQIVLQSSKNEGDNPEVTKRVETIFSNKYVVVKGKFKKFSQQEIINRIKEMGGINEKEVSTKTYFVICDKELDVENQICILEEHLEKIFELEALRKDPWPTPLFKKKKPDNKIPHFISECLKEKGLKKYKLPVKLVSYLGSHSTKIYARCPNIPCHYINDVIPIVYWDDDMDRLDFYTDPNYSRGKYYWFDFEVTGVNEQKMTLRLGINEGDSDCNDGLWGGVWDLKTEKLVANIISTGDCETTIEAISKQHVDAFAKYDKWFPGCEDNREDEDGYSLYENLLYQNDSCFEKLVGLAVMLAMENRD